jgi:alkylation response protein AidB-like acyl-CoA dehydrogenase
MEFTFSDEQDQLRDAVRAFLDQQADGTYMRAMLEDARGVSDDVWQQLAELGWTGVLVPESAGGLGLGMVDLVVLMEEMGRSLFPGPYFSSAVLATLAARTLGLDDRLASLASGTTRGTVAIDEEGHGDVVDRIRTRASRKTGRWLLNGLKPVVVDGHTADWVLVVARTQEGLGTFVVEAPAPSSCRPGIRHERSPDSSSTTRRPKSSDRKVTKLPCGAAWSTTRVSRCVRSSLVRWRRPTTSPSNTRRCACNSTGRSRPSR